MQRAALVLLLSTINDQPSTAFAQGSLTPPGAPAPTMKSLAQIEPRTPISSAPFTISTPGSYYLTTNLVCTVSNAIVIATDSVTLDLGGFTIFSTVDNAANGGAGVVLGSGRKKVNNITIVGGFIQGGVTNNDGVYSGAGFGYGILGPGAGPGNVRVSGVSVAGCMYSGIFLPFGDSTLVDSCTVRTVGEYGIVASTIRGSVVVDCGSDAIYGTQVSDSRGMATVGIGVSANIALNCQGYSSSGTGVHAQTAQDCEGLSTSGVGVDASSTAQNCVGHSGTGTGIRAGTAQNCYGLSGAGPNYGVSAKTAENCYGEASGNTGTGVAADTVLNSSGKSDSGYGVYAYKIATGCSGFSSSGTGLYAFIANVCHGETSTGTALSTSHNVNSF